MAVSSDQLPTATILPHVPILLPIAEDRTAAAEAASAVAPVAPVAAVAVVAVAHPVADTLAVVVSNNVNLRKFYDYEKDIVFVSDDVGSLADIGTGDL